MRVTLSQHTVTFKQFKEVYELQTDGIDYICDAAMIITGMSREEVLRSNLEDLSETIKAFIEVWNDQHEPANHIELNKVKLTLPSVSVHMKALFTDVSLQRYALMQSIATSVNDLREADLDKVTSLLAALYTRPNETFTQELFLERKAAFENASINTVKNAFFLQQRLFSRCSKRILYFSKVSRKLEVLQKKYATSRKGSSRT